MEFCFFCFFFAFAFWFELLGLSNEIRLEHTQKVSIDISVSVLAHCPALFRKYTRITVLEHVYDAALNRFNAFAITDAAFVIIVMLLFLVVP